MTVKKTKRPAPGARKAGSKRTAVPRKAETSPTAPELSPEEPAPGEPAAETPASRESFSNGIAESVETEPVARVSAGGSKPAPGPEIPLARDFASMPMQWFFLRGLARESGHWGSFPSDFKARFPKAELVLLDLPGTGRHFRMKAPLSIEENASFVREEFQKKRDPSKPGFVFSISLGSMVVAEWLHQDDRDIDGVVLCNTSFKGCSPVWKRLWFEAYPHLFRAVRAPNIVAREKHVLAMVSNRPETHERIAREWAELHNERPIRLETFARQLFAASRFEPRLETPSVPVLILSSLADRMVHPSCSETIAERWRAELRRHPTAGHDLPLDAGPWTASAVGDWLSELRLQSRPHRT